MPVKIVAFDLWRTLISGHPPYIMNEIAAKLFFDTPKDFWDYCDNHYFNSDIHVKDLFLKIAKERKLDVDVDSLVAVWNSGWDDIDVYPDTKTFLEKIKKKYKTILISNSGSDDGKRVLKAFGLKEYFDYIIMSYEVGLSKPDPRIFKLVLEKFDVKPEEVVFIGDGLENDFLGGKNVGFKTFLIDRIGKHTEYEREDWFIKSFEELEDKLD